MGGRMSKRPRKPHGIYKRCRRGFLGMSSCPGFTLTRNRVQNPHQRCGGDGWIKIGEKGKGRKKGRGKKRGAMAGVKSYLGWSGAFIGGAGATFGTTGTIVSAVLVAGFTVLRVGVLVMRLSGAAT